MGVLAMWWERYHQGTSRAVFTFLSPIERVLVASRAVWFYLSKLIWPSNLAFIYPRWDIAPTQLLNFAWLLAELSRARQSIFFVDIWDAALRSQRIFRCDSEPGAGVHHALHISLDVCGRSLSVLWPVSVRCIGVCRSGQVGRQFKNGRTLVLSAALFVAAVLATLTWRQAAMYGNIETLWRTTLCQKSQLLDGSQ